jgi:uncharacterized damage-inducible protein DinB
MPNDTTHFDAYAVQRLRRAATDQGHYNLAMLLNAAQTSIVTRQLAAESLPKSDRALAEGVAALLPQLQAAGLEPELLALLDRARVRLAEGELILYDDAPPVFVCRACGQVALRSIPDHCPHCGAGALVFESFPAAFYLEPLPVPVILDQLARTPDWLAALIAGLSDAQAAQAVDGVEGAWSLREAIGHVLDTQELIAQRVALFMKFESPNLTAAAMWGQIESTNLTMTEMLANFRQSRSAMLATLRDAPPAHWLRLGQHSEFGPVTLQQQCGYFAKHEQWHMAQMTRLRRAVGAEQE